MAEPVLEAGAWVYKMFITFALSAIVLSIIGLTLNKELNTREVQKSIFLSRILYSPDSIWANESAIIKPGIVDVAKISNQSDFDTRFHYPDNYGGAKINLTTNTLTKEIYVNRPTFVTLHSQINAGIRGSGLEETHHYPVLVKNGNNEENGILVVTIVMPERT